MLHKEPYRRIFRVLVATPSGQGGQGGIDRLMDSLRSALQHHPRSDLEVTFAASRGAGHIIFSPFYLGQFCLRMLALRLAGRVDLVHINLSSYGSTYRKLIVTAVARLLGVPYVLHLHGADYRLFWSGKRPWLDSLVRSMFEHAGRVIVLGRVWRDFVAKMGPESRIVILPNATPRPQLAHRGGGATTHILFLGRIGDRKGVPQLIEALARMQPLPGWRATIAGDGEVAAAQQQARDLDVAGRIELPGWVDAPRVAELIAVADILVLPSFDENLPVSVIEGMAAGLAVVATPVGAVEDIVSEGETGLLVPPGDVDALAVALTRLVNDPALRARLGKAGLAVHRARLDIEPYVGEITDIWMDAAHRAEAPASVNAK